MPKYPKKLPVEPIVIEEDLVLQSRKKGAIGLWAVALRLSKISHTKGGKNEDTKED